MIKSCGQCGLEEPHEDEGREGDSYDTVLPHRWDGEHLETFYFGDPLPWQQGGGHDDYDHLRESADEAELTRQGRLRPWLPDLEDEEPKGVDSVYTPKT